MAVLLGSRYIPRRWSVASSAMLPLLVLIAANLTAARAPAVTITMRSGGTLSGRLGKVDHVAENPNHPAAPSGAVDVQRIVVLDDGLRRTFVPSRQVQEISEATNDVWEKIKIRQSIARSGASIGSVGPIVKITPFDQFGRRTFTMKAGGGTLSVVQGISEITPIYTTVEGLKVGGKGMRSVVWKMKIATSSLPREILSAILNHSLDQANSDDRLAAVRLYLQSDRYEDAAAELKQVQKDFPNLEGLDGQLRVLRQLSARRLLREIQFRSKAGQHQLAYRLLSKFPDEGVAGETLQHIRELIEGYDHKLQRRGRILAKFDALMAQAGSLADPDRLKRIRDEIEAELTLNTLSRMAAFERLAGDNQLSPEQRLAIAVSGWLLGSDNAHENLAVALSSIDVRAEVRNYVTEPIVKRRTEILGRLRTLEGATVPRVAQLIAHMKPPREMPKTEDGFYELSVSSGTNDPDITYLVQTPPEYDPLKRYPAIVTLNGAGSTAWQQIDWWAGARTENGDRKGQATRRGYITIAIDWQKPHQRGYEYSSREHNAVLRSLRDACRRFSIDTDRVFLSGHSKGGDAAWDIGLAHPDLWAGVIPIVAVSDRYCARYWQNAKHVPTYFVAGELDGGKMAHNARDLDRYLQRGFDTRVVEYLGRGHEHFHDEVQRIFDWMHRHDRDFFPREFECRTMRPWDNYFWWLELGQLPPGAVVLPEDWPRRGKNAVRVSGKINKTGGITVRTGTARSTVWLSPELVDFSKPVAISVTGRRGSAHRKLIEPSLEVLLEDVRGRGERQHPFWAKVAL